MSNRDLLLKAQELLSNKTTFAEAKGKTLALLVGGSKLYGTDTAESDTDFRGVWVNQDLKYTTGFKTLDSIVHEGETDAAFYELGHFLRLCQKTNSQVMELLWAPDEVFLYMHPLFQELRENRDRLFDSARLFSSIRGYGQAEMRLAMGERKGNLGGKRRNTIEKLGYSPKNVVQILRLYRATTNFFKGDGFTVNFKTCALPEHNVFHAALMEIKTQPEKQDVDQLRAQMQWEYDRMVEAYEDTVVDHEFDQDLAAVFVHQARTLF